MATPEEVDRLISEDPDVQAALQAGNTGKVRALAQAMYERTGLINNRQEQPEVVVPTAKSSNELQPQSLRQLGGKVAKFGTEIAGSLEGARRGAIIGAGLPVPPHLKPITTIGGAIIGGAFGGGAGAIAGTPFELATDPTLLKAPSDLGSTFLRGAAAGAMGEAGGQAVRLGLNAIRKPVANYISEFKRTTPEDLAVEQKANQIGVHLTPAEISQGGRAAQIEADVKRSQFARDKFEAMNEERTKRLHDEVQGLVDQHYPAGADLGKVETGKRIQTILDGEVIPEYKQAVRQKYQDLDEASHYTKVDTTNPLTTARELLSTLDPSVHPKAHSMVRKLVDDLSQPGPVTGMKVSRADVETRPEIRSDLRGQSTPLRDSMSTTGENTSDRGFVIPGETKLQGAVPGGMAGQPQLRVTTRSEAPRQATRLDFLKAHDLRSELLAIQRASGENLPPRYNALAGKLAGEVDEAMSTSAQAASPQVYNLWREANDFVKKGHELYDSATLTNVLKRDPEDVVGMAFRKGEVTPTRRIFEALDKGNPYAAAEGKMLYRRAAMQKVLEQAGGNPQKLYGVLYGPNGVGVDVLKETFEPQFLNELNQLVNVAKRMNVGETTGKAANPSGTARGLISAAENSMLLRIPSDFFKNAIQGHFGKAVAESARDVQEAGIRVLTMKNLADLMTTTEGIKLLKEGLQIAPNSARASRVVGQILAHISVGEPSKKSTPKPTTALPQAFSNQQ